MKRSVEVHGQGTVLSQTAPSALSSGAPQGRACTLHVCDALANERLWPNRILSVSLLRKVAFKLSEFDFIGLAVGVYRSSAEAAP